MRATGSNGLGKPIYEVELDIPETPLRGEVNVMPAKSLVCNEIVRPTMISKTAAHSTKSKGTRTNILVVSQHFLFNHNHNITNILH